MFDVNSLIGVAGLILILVAFTLNLTHKLTPKSTVYNLLNVFGSVCLAYYSWFLGSIPFFILQIVWGLLSLAKLFHVYVLSR